MRNSDGAGGGGWGEESRAVLALIFCAAQRKNAKIGLKSASII